MAALFGLSLFVRHDSTISSCPAPAWSRSPTRTTSGTRLRWAASTLFEAATLAMAEFRKCGFTENIPGPAATRLTVTVKGPSTSHEIQWGKIETLI